MIVASMFLLSACNNTSETSEKYGDIVISSTEELSEVLGEEITNTHTTPIDYSSLDLDKYITIGEYEKIVESPENMIATDEEVMNQLQSISKSLITNFEEVHEGVIEENSSLNVSYTTKVNGEEVGSMPSLDMVIGGEFIHEGVDSQLVGKNVGDVVSVNVLYPHDYYDASLAGQDAVIDITINYILANGTPVELNDEFASVFSNGEFNTLDELKQSMKDTLTTSKKEQFASTLMEKILENTEVIGDTSEFEQREYRIELDSCANLIGTQGTTMEQLASIYSIGTVDEFKQYLRESSTKTVKEKMVINKFAKMFDISVSDEEYKEYIDELLKFHPQETVDLSYPENESRYKLLYDKVTEKLISLQ